MAIFYGSTLIKNELESGNLFFLLPKLSSRSPYIMGRILGVALILCLEMCSMSAFLFGIFKFFGGEFNYLIFICLIFTYLTSLILLLVAVFFSQITNTITTIFSSIFVYLIGYGLFNSLEMKIIPDGTIAKSFLEFLSYFFPNFYALDIKDYLFYKNHLDNGYIVRIIFSALFYIFILIVINLNIFRKKDL
jgi:ABC-type transport system involved in multi-copper enzyme maturation permease subunit